MPGLHPRIGNGFQSSKGSNPTVCLPKSIEPRRRKKRPAEVLSQQVYPGMVVEVHLEVVHLFRSVFTLTLCMVAMLGEEHRTMDMFGTKNFL